MEGEPGQVQPTGVRRVLKLYPKEAYENWLRRNGDSKTTETWGSGKPKTSSVRVVFEKAFEEHLERFKREAPARGIPEEEIVPRALLAAHARVKAGMYGTSAVAWKEQLERIDGKRLKLYEKIRDDKSRRKFIFDRLNTLAEGGQKETEFYKAWDSFRRANEGIMYSLDEMKMACEAPALKTEQRPNQPEPEEIDPREVRTELRQFQVVWFVFYDDDEKKSVEKHRRLPAHDDSRSRQIPIPVGRPTLDHDADFIVELIEARDLHTEFHTVVPPELMIGARYLGLGVREYRESDEAWLWDFVDMQPSSKEPTRQYIRTQQKPDFDAITKCINDKEVLKNKFLAAHKRNPKDALDLIESDEVFKQIEENYKEFDLSQEQIHKMKEWRKMLGH